MINMISKSVEKIDSIFFQHAFARNMIKTSGLKLGRKARSKTRNIVKKWFFQFLPKIGRKEMSETGSTKLVLKFNLPKLWGKEFCAKLFQKYIFEEYLSGVQVAYRIESVVRIHQMKLFVE